MCHGLLKKGNNLQQNLKELQKIYGNQKVGLVFLLKNSGKMGLTAYTTPTVRDIFSFAVFFLVSRPFCRFTLVYEGRFMLCYKEKLEPLITSCYGKFLRGHSSAWFPLFISACRFVEFDTSNLYLPYVSALSWLTSIARYVFKSPGIWFWETEYDIYCERVACLHISILWGRARPWFELFASTVRVRRFLSRVSYYFTLARFSSETP